MAYKSQSLQNGKKKDDARQRLYDAFTSLERGFKPSMPSQPSRPSKSQSTGSAYGDKARADYNRGQWAKRDQQANREQRQLNQAFQSIERDEEKRRKNEEEERRKKQQMNQAFQHSLRK